MRDFLPFVLHAVAWHNMSGGPFLKADLLKGKKEEKPLRGFTRGEEGEKKPSHNPFWGILATTERGGEKERGGGVCAAYGGSHSALPLFSPKTKKSCRPVGFKKPQERRGLVRRREREKVLRR